MIKLMERENISMLTELFMKGIGTMINKMEMEMKLGMMVPDMKENI